MSIIPIRRNSSGSPTGSYSGSDQHTESDVNFIFISTVNQDQLVDRSFKELLCARQGDEEADLAYKPIFTGIDFGHSGKWPLVSRAGIIANKDNITNLAVRTDIIPFLAFLL